MYLFIFYFEFKCIFSEATLTTMNSVSCFKQESYHFFDSIKYQINYLDLKVQDLNYY